MRWLIPILAAVAVFFAGYFAGRGSVEVEPPQTVVRIDTLFYERPQPVRVLPPTFASVRVPRVIFAPGDTVIRVVSIPASGAVSGEDRDSVDVLVTVERKQYGDSTYRAQVSGPAIGEFCPALDWIEVYSRTSERVQTVTKRSRFAVTAGVGAAYTPQGFQPYVGVGVGVIVWQW